MANEKAIKPNRPSSAFHGGNFWYLFAGLLLTLLAVPFSQRLFGGGRYSLTLLFSLFMLVAIWSLSTAQRIFQVGVLLVLSIFVIAGAIALTGASQFLTLSAVVLMLIFCALSCFIAARHVFAMQQVDLNSLVGAFCVYLLLGMIWALLYHLLLLFEPSAFTGNISVQDQRTFPDMLYFSFVTLASLGYGDISPVGELTRTLAYLEAVTGQFYLAVMVASLVGVYSAKRKQ
jgi:Ion channel.